jgi:hypothetical protein
MGITTGIEGERKGDTKGGERDKRRKRKKEERGTRTRTRRKRTSYLFGMVWGVLELPIPDGF